MSCYTMTILHASLFQWIDESTTSSYKTNSRLRLIWSTDNWSNILWWRLLCCIIAIYSEHENVGQCQLAAVRAMRTFQSKQFSDQRRVLFSMISTSVGNQSKQQKNRTKSAVKVEVSFFFYGLQFGLGSGLRVIYTLEMRMQIDFFFFCLWEVSTWRWGCTRCSSRSKLWLYREKDINEWSPTKVCFNCSEWFNEIFKIR